MAGAYDNEETIGTRKLVAGAFAARRNARGLPRHEVAARMEIDPSDVGKLERGGTNFTWSRLFRWAKAVGYRIEFVQVGDGGGGGDDDGADYIPRFR